jgi:hypothetical protein
VAKKSHVWDLWFNVKKNIQIHKILNKTKKNNAFKPRKNPVRRRQKTKRKRNQVNGSNANDKGVPRFLFLAAETSTL